MSATKNVGGPIMKLICSRSMISMAWSGSQRGITWLRIPRTPGSSTAFSSPEMCASGAGISTESVAASRCASAMTRALYARPRCVWSAALGPPVEPEVNSTTPTSEPRAAERSADAPASSSATNRLLGPRTSSVARNTAGSRVASIPSTSAGPARWWIGPAIAPSRQHAR